MRSSIISLGRTTIVYRESNIDSITFRKHKIFAGLRAVDPLRTLELDARLFAHRHGAGLHRSANQVFPAMWHSLLAVLLLVRKFHLEGKGGMPL